MQIRLIVPLVEEDGERSKGTSSEPTFCPFVAHRADATGRGLVLGILLRDRVSLYMWQRRTMNATDNEASHIFIADGIDLFGIPPITNSRLKQMPSSVE